MAGEFVGQYRFGFEVSEFRPAGSDERWWVRNETEKLLAAVTAPESGHVGGTADVRVIGDLSPKGRFGHSAGYSRELVVRDVLEVRNLRYGFLSQP